MHKITQQFLDGYCMVWFMNRLISLCGMADANTEAYLCWITYKRCFCKSLQIWTQNPNTIYFMISFKSKYNKFDFENSGLQDNRKYNILVHCVQPFVNIPTEIVFGAPLFSVFWPNIEQPSNNSVMTTHKRSIINVYPCLKRIFPSWEKKEWQK